MANFHPNIAIKWCRCGSRLRGRLSGSRTWGAAPAMWSETGSRTSGSGQDASIPVVHRRPSSHRNRSSRFWI